MKVAKIHAVWFSPTGNTEKVVNAVADVLAKHWGIEKETFDFTLPAARENVKEFAEGDLVVFGTPVYAGRVPNKLLSTVQEKFRGNGALAVPVVTFGNRNFDNGLIELRNELENDGFHTVAGAAVASQHAFSKVLAVGRPDDKDMEKILAFAAQVAEKVDGMSEICEPVAVRGDDPVGPYYTPRGLDGEPKVFLKAKPKTDEAKCDKCGLCAKSCPMGSISAENPAEVSGICIKCHACVNKCPKEAKYFDDEAFLSHKGMLERDYMRRAESELFL